jgi:hypothetical protein
MNCIHLTLVFLSLSSCHQQLPRRLPGIWVGTLRVSGEPRLVRAEFIPAGSGLTGTLHLEGAGDMNLVRASESDGSVGFEMSRGDEEIIFIGAFRAGSIVGRVHHAGEQMAFELRRMVEIDGRVPRAVVGTYLRPDHGFRAIVDSTCEAGWQQLIWKWTRSLFATSSN